MFCIIQECAPSSATQRLLAVAVGNRLRASIYHTRITANMNSFHIPVVVTRTMSPVCVCLGTPIRQHRNIAQSFLLAPLGTYCSVFTFLWFHKSPFSSPFRRFLGETFATQQYPGMRSRFKPRGWNRPRILMESGKACSGYIRH